MKTKSELAGNSETVAETTTGAPVLDVDGEEIEPVWAAEFRGFFWGEGTLGFTAGQPLQQRNPQWTWKRHSFAVTASIGLRSDDAPLLAAFQRRLGGALRTEPYRFADPRKTITRWVCGTAVNNLRIARLLRSPTGLPFNKARQLDLWEEAVRLKLAAGGTAGSRYTDEQHARMLDIGQALVAVRVWSG